MPRAGAFAAGAALLTTVCGVHAEPTAAADNATTKATPRIEHVKLSKVCMSPRVVRRA
jgi:hypothetical protein